MTQTILPDMTLSPEPCRRGSGSACRRGAACLLMVLSLTVLPVAAEKGTDAAANGSGGETPQQPSPTGQSESGSEPSLEERLDALLSETLPAGEYRESRRCLPRSAYRKIEVLNEEYVLFSKGDDHWINRLKRRCPSLRFNELPVFVQRGTNSLCESDPFYPTNSMDLRMGLSGGRPMGAQGICYLGGFEQISAEQAALLRDG